MPAPWRFLGIAMIVLAFASAALKAEEKEDAGLKGWLADLEALQQGLARNYANFEYTLQERRIDLPSMAERYRGRLIAATTDAERRRVLEQLLEDFRDGHVNVRWGEGTEGGPAPAACRADMAGRATREGVNWSRLEAFQPLESLHARTFSAGLLRRQGRPPLGVVRIGLFSERVFLAECKAAAAELGIDPEQPCDRDCAKRLDRLTVAKLGEALRATVSELRRAGVRGLVVDVSNNGGGTDWAEVVARTLAGNDLRSARVALLKHPAWEGYLDRWLSEMEPQLPAATGTERKRLERAIEVARAARRAVAERCDLSAAWSDSALAMGKKSLPCSTLVKTDLFTGGFEPAFTPAAQGGAPSAMDTLLVPTLGYYGPPPALEERLPLIVVVNRETHSAAEQFAALLRDNDRATIVGEPSGGSACGTFTGEGTAFTLPHSGGRVHVPDCVRLRADGSNERQGIIPDHLIPWAPSNSAYQRARKTLEVLERVR